MQRLPSVGHTNSNDHPSSVSALPDRSRLSRQPLRIFRESEPGLTVRAENLRPFRSEDPKEAEAKRDVYCNTYAYYKSYSRALGTLLNRRRSQGGAYGSSF